MKIICIDGSVGKLRGNFPTFKEGDELEAIQSPSYENYYEIIGHEYSRQGTWVHWHKSRFIPLSSIDETEMILKTKNESIPELIK